MLKKLFASGAFLFFLGHSAFSAPATRADQPDSVYLFSYGENGLRFAYSRDKQNWTPIGNGFIFLKCDYGAWGSEKKMHAPYLINTKNGGWELVWGLNDRTLQFARAASKDLITWGPQSYPYVQKGKNVLRPVISLNTTTGLYTIVYADADGKYFLTGTHDFRTYTPAEEVAASRYQNASITVSVSGETVPGQVHRVSWKVVDGLIRNFQLQQYRSAQNAEVTRDDPQRFAGLKPVAAKIVLQPQRIKPISNLLTGVFFEDINYAADGGLYAELIQNRDFEYQPQDKKYRDRNWISSYAWSLKGEGSSFTIDSVKPLHPNNPHYAVLSTRKGGGYLVNSGYDAIAVKGGDRYDFSVFVNLVSGSGKMEVRLVSDKQGLLAKSTISASSGGWKQVKSTLTPSADAADARLELQFLNTATAWLDMISLFPQKTFKGHKNGLRADLAQTIADIHPRFVRFPGGCVAHGDGLDNIYKWKNSIGPLEARKPDRNLWGYHQSMGLGYLEYFQFCEDIGAEAVPVLAAGVPCQNSSTGGGGQQGGIPMSEMGQYIQDIIDLVEWANGDATTPWGKKRAEAGHPKPFNLKYIGIGNEDQITDVFRERIVMIYEALKKSHPEITVIGTVGPFFEGTDYEAGWEIASGLNVPVVDEHYYQPPGWFINNQDYYDKYDRSKPKVYLGEYAASLPGGTKTNLETSLSEALYLTAVERNGDVVHMASYAPLLGKEGHTQWNPDLIYFNNTEIKPTISYYVQQLYGQNAGDQYVSSTIKLSAPGDNVSKRIACSVVKDSRSGDLIVKLVNLLPVETSAELDFSGMKPASAKTIKTTITGKPADRAAKPVVAEVNPAEDGSLRLPPYSFTVLRISGK
jgi:alpha-L-arabinofuranosidase